MPKSTVEQIQELDAQREQILTEAKTNALERAEEAVSELNALGFHYYIGETEKNIRSSMKMKAKRVANKSARHKPSTEKLCPICDFQTDPPHDRRSHRTQTRKRAFTDKELEAWGMARL